MSYNDKPFFNHRKRHYSHVSQKSKLGSERPDFNIYHESDYISELARFYKGKKESK